MVTLSPTQQAQFEALSQLQRELLAVSAVFAPQAAFTPQALICVWKQEILTDEQAAVFINHLESLTPHFFTVQDTLYQHVDEQIYLFAKDNLLVPALAEGAYRLHLRYYQNRSESWLIPHELDAVLESEVAQYGQAFRWAQVSGYEHLLGFIVAGCQHLARYRAYRPQVRSWLDTTLAILQTRGDKWGMPAQIRILGDIALQVMHLKTARDLYYLALQRWGEAGLAGQAHTFKSLGDLSEVEHDWDSAKSFFQKALVLYEVVNFKLGQANALKQLGALYARLNDYASAYQAYQKAIKLYGEMNFDAEQANALKELADVYAQRRQYDQATAHYEEAYKLFAKIEFWSEQAHVLLAEGRMFSYQNQIEAAQERYDRALPIFQQTGDRLGLAHIYRALGDIHLGKQAYPEAIQAFEQADEFYQSVNDLDAAGMMHYILANLYWDIGNPRQAVQIMLNTVAVLAAMEGPINAHEVRAGLKQLAAGMGNQFFDLWNSLSQGAEIPEWLDPTPLRGISADLQAALESTETLQAILGENPHRTLKKVAHLSLEDRVAWLERALNLSAGEDMNSHFHRAFILKEVASLPNQAVSETLHAAIAAFDAALGVAPTQIDYGRVQNKRVGLLRDMAGMRGENRGQLLKLALEGCTLALEKLRGTPDYIQLRFNQANLLRELAGLRGEDRAAWMGQALAAYDELLTLTAPTPLEQATTQTNRASLLQEIADLANEDSQQRLKEALQAASHAYLITQQAPEAKTYQRVAERMLSNVRKMIVETFDSATFDRWWAAEVGSAEPDWLKL